jgi:hypothetical protein
MDVLHFFFSFELSYLKSASESPSGGTPTRGMTVRSVWTGIRRERRAFSGKLISAKVNAGRPSRTYRSARPSGTLDPIGGQSLFSPAIGNPLGDIKGLTSKPIARCRRKPSADAR